MKRTYQPNKRKRAKTHGFRARMATVGGRKVIARRRKSKIIARKKSFANSCFIIYKDENQMGHGRVGISVSKKLGNAVTRNKIKRQLRMMIQECFHFDEEVDYIVIVRKRFLDNTYIENKKELEYLYKKVKRKEISK